jgi:hypothetical protein
MLQMWSDMAKNLTFHAINKAGFTTRYFPGLRDIVFMTEPEAAALYSVKYFIAEDGNDNLLQVFTQCQTLISVSNVKGW